MVTTTSKVKEGSRKRLFETSGDEQVNIVEACRIEGKECEAYGVEKIATDNDIEMKEAKDD